MQARKDLQLVERVLAKERAAFDEFFAIYFPRLARFCSARVSDGQAVEDIVQETMVKAIRSLHTYRGEALLFTWLCGICRNQISNWYKQQKRHTEKHHSLDDNPDIIAALESFGIDVQSTLDDRIALQDLVTLTLDYLPESYSRVLEMKYLEGMSVKEISAILGASRLATQSLLSRARSAFRLGFKELLVSSEGL